MIGFHLFLSFVFLISTFLLVFSLRKRLSSHRESLKKMADRSGGRLVPSRSCGTVPEGTEEGRTCSKPLASLLSAFSDLRGEFNGTPYRFRFTPKSRNSPPQGTVTFLVPQGLAGSVRREGKFDRWGKSIGLNREIQTGDSAFDTPYYLSGEPEGPFSLLFSQSQCRQAIQNLFSLPFPLKEVIFSPEGLTLAFTPFREEHLESFDPRLCAPDALTLLQEASKLPLIPYGLVVPPKRSSLPLFLLSGFLALGGTVALIVGLTLYPPLDKSFLLGSLRYVFPLLFLYLFFAFHFLKGHPQSHIRFFQLFLLSLPAFFLSGTGFFAYGNGALDKSEPETCQTLIVDKTITKNKNSYTYTLLLLSWRHPGGTERINVDQEIFTASRQGDGVEVTTRQGHFKAPWVERVSLLSPKGPLF